MAIRQRMTDRLETPDGNVPKFPIVPLSLSVYPCLAWPLRSKTRSPSFTRFCSQSRFDKRRVLVLRASDVVTHVAQTSLTSSLFADNDKENTPVITIEPDLNSAAPLPTGARQTADVDAISRYQ